MKTEAELAQLQAEAAEKRARIAKLNARRLLKFNDMSKKSCAVLRTAKWAAMAWRAAEVWSEVSASAWGAASSAADEAAAAWAAAELAQATVEQLNNESDEVRKS